MIIEVFAGHQSMVRKILETKWLVWVGTISYGLYLWHYIIFLALDSLDFNRYADFVLGTLISFFLATLSYYAMEKPILMLLRLA